MELLLISLTVTVTPTLPASLHVSIRMERLMSKPSPLFFIVLQAHNSVSLLVNLIIRHLNIQFILQRRPEVVAPFPLNFIYCN